MTYIGRLKVIFINIIAIFIMSEELATPDLIKINLFGSKGYDVIFFYNVTMLSFNMSQHVII